MRTSKLLPPVFALTLATLAVACGGQVAESASNANGNNGAETGASSGSGGVGATGNVVPHSTTIEDAAGASVAITRDDLFACHGTLIHPRLVLTSRMCLMGITPDNAPDCKFNGEAPSLAGLQVLQGDESHPARALGIEKVRYEIYKTDCARDIAVLVLKDEGSATNYPRIRFDKRPSMYDKVGFSQTSCSGKNCTVQTSRAFVTLTGDMGGFLRSGEIVESGLIEVDARDGGPGGRGVGLLDESGSILGVGTPYYPNESLFAETYETEEFFRSVYAGVGSAP